MKKAFIFMLFYLCVLIVNLFGQSLPQRFSIPSWVKMGMTRSEITKIMNYEFLFDTYSSYWEFKSTVDSNDTYGFGFNDKEILTKFRITAKYNHKSLVDSLIRLYGNQSQQDRENNIWRLNNGVLSNVSSIRVWSRNENEIIITYYFTNEIEGINYDIQRDMVSRGHEALNRGEYDTAILELSNVLRLVPRHDAAYHLRGQAYFKKNEIDRALSDFNEAIRLSPNRKDFHYSRGAAFEAKNNYDAAISDYTREIAIQPDNYYAYARRGVIYKEKMNINQAISDLKKACDSDALFNTFSPIYSFLLGEIYHKEKQNYGEAVKYYSLALEVFKHEETSRREMLKIADDLGFIIYKARARSYLALDNNNAALADLNKVLNISKVEDTNFDAYSIRGLVNYNLNKYNEAVSDFNNYLKIKTLHDDQKANTYYLRAKSFLFLKNNNASLNDFNEYFKLSKNKEIFYDAYLLRGLLLFNSKKFDDSISDFDNYLNIKTLTKEQKIEGYRYRAKAYLNIKDYFSALEDFYEIYHLNPKDEEAIQGIAAISKELGITP